jgi:hypothetical protein
MPRLSELGRSAEKRYVQCMRLRTHNPEVAGPRQELCRSSRLVDGLGEPRSLGDEEPSAATRMLHSLWFPIAIEITFCLWTR